MESQGSQGEHTRDSCMGSSQEATKVLGKPHDYVRKWSAKMDQTRVVVAVN